MTLRDEKGDEVAKIHKNFEQLIAKDELNRRTECNGDIRKTSELLRELKEVYPSESRADLECRCVTFIEQRFDISSRPS
jgi:hypothetical protein